MRLRHDVSFPTESLADWSDWATDDGRHQMSACPENTAAVQVGCSGDLCDNIRLRCANVPGLSSRSWVSNWFSEEGDAGARCPANGVITKMECKRRSCLVGSNCGHFCDIK